MISNVSSAPDMRKERYTVEGTLWLQFVQQLINGISLGSIYALIALGYTMVYGIMKLINFAHGDIYMIGSYVGFFAITALCTGDSGGDGHDGDFGDGRRTAGV